MIRLFILGFITIIGLIVTTISLIIIFNLVKWVKRWTKSIFSTSKVFIDQQRQNWKTRQAENNVPRFMRDASKRLAHVDLLVEQLPRKWQHLIDPLVKEAHELVRMGMEKSEQVGLIRNYYTTTLKAVERLIEGLVEMRSLHMNTDVMQETEERKAKEAIEILIKDTYKYQSKLVSKKKFDFHVMMEVIKQRFGK